MYNNKKNRGRKPCAHAAVPEHVYELGNYVLSCAVRLCLSLHFRLRALEIDENVASLHGFYSFHHFSYRHRVSAHGSNALE